MKAILLNNKKGFALITTYFVSLSVLGLSTAAWTQAFFEMRQVERELNRVRSFAAAEAGLQTAMAQIGQNAYTGFINTASINVTNFRAVDGTSVGSFAVNLAYPNSADWITVSSAATVGSESRTVEGRVFLDSNLSKFLIYADTPNLALGNNLRFGTHDGVSPEGVPSNPEERAATYNTGNLTYSGTNIHTYGDAHVEGSVNGGNNTSVIHGDTYASGFQTNASGAVTNDGVSGAIGIRDGYADDIDRNQNGVVDSADAPDHHDLTAAGGGDAHKTEKLLAINHAFYSQHNDVPAFAGADPKSRFLKFEADAGGTGTRIVEYSNAQFKTLVQSYTLPANAIVYVNGDAYVKGEIKGRVSVVSTDDIVFDGHVKYEGSQSYVDSNHSAAFLAKNKVYFRPEDLEVSGIIYAEKAGAPNNLAVDSGYNTRWEWRPSDKQDGHFRHFGNLILNGQANTSYYQNDRAYVYDPNLKYFRPPGIPVVPDLRIVRETS